MSPWDDQHVRALVDELERLGKIPTQVADEARAAADEGNHSEALDVALERDQVRESERPSSPNGPSGDRDGNGARTGPTTARSTED